MTLLDVQCEHIILFLFIFLSHVWLTADCVSPRLTRSILQQLFYGLLFPSYLEAGEKTKGWKCYCFLRWRDGGIFFFLGGGCLDLTFRCLNRLLFPAESADEDIPDAMFKESCITEQTQYFFDNDERSYSGVLDCGNCSRYLRFFPRLKYRHQRVWYQLTRDDPYLRYLCCSGKFT